MNNIRLILTLLLLAMLVMVAGCDKHYVDVYVNNQCALVAIDNDTAINPLVVFPGDFVIFNNISGDDVDIDLPDGVFDQDPIHIPKGKRVIVEVIETDPGESGMVIICKIGGSGAPTVVVGEEP